MDLTRLAVDAGQFINRAVQLTGETLGQAERTELDPDLEELLARTDATKTWTDRMMFQMEILLQPSPGARLEDRLYGHLDWTVPPRPRLLESLGDQMLQAGLEMGPNTPYGESACAPGQPLKNARHQNRVCVWSTGASLLRCGQTQKLLGEAENKFVESICLLFLTPLKRFAEVEYRVVQDKRRMLLNRRLDLDIAIRRLKKAHEADREARNLNFDPLDNDYVPQVSFMFSFLRVKWLKMWAQEISQAEKELKSCQTLFDCQSATMRRTVEGIGDTHLNHRRSLGDLVEAQACYYEQCSRHARALQSRLASIPAVLCSGNWQSAVGTRELRTNGYASNKSDILNTVEVRQIKEDINTANESQSTNDTANESQSTNNTANESPSANETREL
ncbi:endophilin-B1-like [Brachionichthys hirsutus]|uniref:endophilin-B1-like n=1 Tax=Brachionichthys hirsutus TaxID=412623 RepID=UPI0036045749